MTEIQELRKKAVGIAAENMSMEGMYTYINLDTWEVKEVMEFNEFAYTKEELEELKEEEPDWGNMITIHPLETSESFRIMRDFVWYALPEGEFQRMMEIVLDSPRPFANFNNQIHNSGYREQWFAYRKNWLEKEVKTQIILKLKGDYCDDDDLEDFYPAE